MAKILLYISGALLVASAFLGYKNMTSLNDNHEKLVQTNTQLKASQEDTAKTKKQLAKTNSDLDAATKQVKAVTDDLTTAKQQVDQLTKEKADTEQKLADANTALDAAKKQIDTLSHPTTPAGVPVEDATKRIADLETQVKELQTVKTTLDSQLKAADANVQHLQVEEDRRQRGVMAKGLAGTVLAVDRNWNFVVLNLGDRNGVVANAEMIIQRGGSMVGKVRITSVEMGQSIADILPNSVPPGIVIQPGDRVIYPGG